MKSKIDEVIDNLSKLLDDSFEEWSGGRRLETSCIATYDSAEAIDYAQFAIKELIEQLRPYILMSEIIIENLDEMSKIDREDEDVVEARILNFYNQIKQEQGDE